MNLTFPAAARRREPNRILLTNGFCSPLILNNKNNVFFFFTVWVKQRNGGHLPRIAELSLAQIGSRFDGHNCLPSGLAQGLEYANRLNAS